MSMHQQMMGAALANVAHEIGRIGEALGPVTLMIENVGDSNICIGITKLSDGTRVALSDDTDVAAENTGYSGNASDKNFSGQFLNGPVAGCPIVPGTVVITPVSGGNTRIAYDTDADGNLYATISLVKTLVGTVDYHTGALTLRYPTGSEPNTGVIAADYSYNADALCPLGKVSKRISNLPPTETLIVKAAAATSTGHSEVRIEAFLSY